MWIFCESKQHPLMPDLMRVRGSWLAANEKCSCAFDSEPILKHLLIWRTALGRGLLYGWIKPYQGHLYGNTRARQSGEAFRKKITLWFGNERYWNVFSASKNKLLNIIFWVGRFYLCQPLFCLEPLTQWLRVGNVNLHFLSKHSLTKVMVMHIH